MKDIGENDSEDYENFGSSRGEGEFTFTALNMGKDECCVETIQPLKLFRELLLND